MTTHEIRHAGRLSLRAAGAWAGAAVLLTLGMAGPALAAGPGHPAASGDLYGYAATGSKITDVTGGWKVPTATCTSDSQDTAIWASLGGSTSPTSDQLGVSITCSAGKAAYTAFMELYPQPPVYFKNTVKAGDSIDVSISVAGSSTLKLLIKDTTQGWSHSESASGAAATSADWLVEDGTGLTWTPVKFTIGANGGKAFTKIVGSSKTITVSDLRDDSFTVSSTAASLAASPGAPDQASSGDAGYVSSGSDGSYTSVSSSWIEPTAHCTSGDQYVSFWVGLDGYSSDTVEQAGSEADCIGKTAEYYAWYELYPSPAVNFSNTVKAGDQLSSSVTYDGSNEFTIKVSDATQGWTKTVKKTLAGAARSSAEILVAAPSSGTGTLPMTDFGSVSFTGATVNGSGLCDADPVKVTSPGLTVSPISDCTNFTVSQTP